MVNLGRTTLHLQGDVIHQVVVWRSEVPSYLARKSCLSAILKRERMRAAAAERKANGKTN